MADKIQIKRSSEEGKKPTPEQLADGELALNLKDKKIYAKDSDGVVQEFPAVDAVDVGVEKVNDLTGEITIKGSDNINVTKSGQNITLNTTSNVALKSDLPADLNLTEGDGINITGSYPNITITNEVTKIDDLSDVDTDGKQANQVLTYNGTSWVPGLSDSGGDENVQSNWTETDQTSDAFILNKPSNLSDFNNDLTLPPADAEKNVQSDWDEATTTSDAYILNKPTNLSEFENDLTLPPSDAEKNVQSDWTEADTSADAFILNKPTNLSQFNNDINISADNVTGLPVTHLESGNELTLNVSDEGNGTWTLTALNQGGGSGGGSGNLNLIEGDCINIAAVENATDSNVTDVTIGLDTDCDSITSNLPISSTDGTVTLDSPSANTFTVSTNSVDNRLAVNGRGMVGVGNAGTNSICLYVNSVPTNATGLSGITCIPEIITADAEEVSAVKTQANLGAAVAADYFNHFITGSSAGTGTAATMNGVRIIDTSLTGTTKNVAFSTNLPADSEKNFSIETGTAPSVFAGQVQTDTITTKDAAEGDGKINLSGIGVELYSNHNNWDTSFKLAGNSLQYSIGANASDNKVFLPNPAYIEDVDSRPDDYDPATPKRVQHLQQYYYGLGWASGTVQNAGAGGTTFDYQVGSLVTMARKQNSLICYRTDKTESAAVLTTCDGTNKNARISIDGIARVTVTEDDIKASDGYVPTSDNSLVTKGWVTTNGASGTLPISSTDGKVRLEQHATVKDRLDVRIDGQAVQSIIPEQVVSWGQFAAGAAGGFGATNPSYAFGGAEDTGFYLTSPAGGKAVNISVGGQEQVAFTDSAAIFAGQVQTDTITSKDGAAGDASIDLGANFTVSTGAFYLNVGNPSKNITIGDNTSGIAGGDGVYITSRTHDIAFSSDEIRFNTHWSGGATEPTWVMTTDSGLVGNNQANYIKCGSVSGTADNDASIQLDAELTVSTGGVERVKVKPASYGSGAVTIGEDHAHSIGGVSIKNDPTQVTYSSQMQVRFVDENGQYAYTGCTEPRFAVGGNNALLDGGVFFAGHDNGNAVLFSGTGDVIIATGGLAASSERLRITDDSIQSDVDVKTSSVSGLADNDASLALGASATITVTGSGVFQVSNSGNNRALYLSPSGELGIGRLPSTGVALDVYQPTSGARFQSTLDDVNSRIIFQEGSLTDEQFSFDRYGTNFSGSTTGSVANKSAVIRNEADAALVIVTGGSNTSDNNAIQLRPGASNINVNGYALKANSDRTVEVPGEIQTPKITGSAAPDNDASIQLDAHAKITAGVAYYQILNNGYHIFQSDGSQSRFTNDGDFLIGTQTAFAGDGTIDATKTVVLSEGKKGIARWSARETSSSQTTDLYLSCDYDRSEVVLNSNSQVVLEQNDGSDYTPTQPNSIATRAYVDASAGSAGLVPFGTPTDDTTPDSPNGSTLHDNMFLYVKGTTSWRKSALYPLDSTGGGSNFPLPQPGLDAGLEWTGYDVPVAAGSSGGGATVAAVGNAFFLLHQWSLNGTDWYPTSWADPQKLVVSPNSLTASYGQNVFCGADGYSYDGRNWTNYTLSSESQRIGSSGGSFFYQGKHYARGGSHYFNGESWLSTGMTGSGMNDDSNYVIPCDACCVGINLSSTANLQIYTAGDMSDGVNRWRFATESGTSNPVGQGLLCVARDAATDICVALTNEHAWVQTNSGSTSFRKIALPVSAAWGGITHDGNNFIAVASGENSNISIRSDDGVTWEQSTTLDNPGVTSMAGFNGRAITSGVLPGIGQSRVASILVSGNPPPSFRSFEVNGQEMKSQTQTNEFLLQEINRLQKLIEEKCSS